MVSVCEKSGRALPQFAADDVIDYLVMEAVVSKWYKEQDEFQKDAEKKAELETWNKDFSKLKEFE